MVAYFFRLSALAIRFLCPLAALALSNTETMGRYYLFISYFTFVVGVSALELAIPFSRMFLRGRSDRQRQLIFSGFMANQIVITAALAIPAGVLIASWAGVPTALIPLFCLSLATEASVNEVGRFFWNIGQWRMPSLRDLIRALIFTTAIVASVYFEEEILTPLTFLTISTGNLAIMASEWRTWGGGGSAKSLHKIDNLRATWFRVRRSLGGSFPQFVHMQLLGLQPLLERVVIEKSLGLVAVASFSFLTSVMQSVAGLQLVPIIAQTRQRLLSARTVSDRIGANRGALILLMKASMVSGAWALILYFGLPLLVYLVDKQVPTSPLMLFAAFLSSLSAIFCSAIAPLLTEKRHALKANIVTCLIISPLLIVQCMIFDGSAFSSSLLVIGGVAVMHLVSRTVFVYQQMTN